MRLARGVVGVCGLWFLAASARAEPAPQVEHFVLKVGTIAPDGSSWARELKAFAKDVETRTSGRVRIRLVMNGTAGDEVEMSHRIARSQLDGVASGGIMCQLAAPSTGVLRLFGVFQSREESNYVLREMLPQIAQEASKNGFAMLGVGGLGADVILSRSPLRTLQEIKAAKLWRWDLDTTGNAVAHAMGWSVVELPVWDASKAYDQGKIDGFSGILGAALAFQWYAKAKYMTPLPTSFLAGCIVMASRALDPLPADDQQVVRTASTKLIARIQTVGAEMDNALFTIFQKRGIKLIPVTSGLRAEFFEAARAAREKLGEKLVARAILDRALQLLADFRAEHRN